MNRIEQYQALPEKHVGGDTSAALSRELHAQFKTTGQPDRSVARSIDAQVAFVDFGDPRSLYGSSERARLQGRMADPEMNEMMQRNMAQFEEAAAARGITPAQIAATYANLNRMLDASTAALPPAQRARIALQTIAHATDPSGIDQGRHNTCSVAALQERVFTNNPEQASRIIADVATRGSWTAPDGRRINLEHQSLLPGEEERNAVPGDAQRSHASQLFQTALLNDIYQRQDPNMRYVQGNPTGKADTGERTIWLNGKKIEFPGITPEELYGAAQRLGQDGNSVLTHSVFPHDRQQRTVQSEQDLQQRLQESVTNNRLPLVAFVNAGDPVFSGPGDASRFSGHYISITGYDRKTGMVTISNQWGRESDRRVSLRDLYRAMSPGARGQNNSADSNTDHMRKH